MATCYNCGGELPADMPIYRSSTCPSCGKEVKVCLNCRFYEPGAHWDCRETVNELVVEKDRANFCEFFAVATANRLKTGSTKATKQARSNFDRLFGNG